MSELKIFSTDYFPSLHNSEEYFNKITNEQTIGGRIIGQFLLFCIFSFFYGVVVGIYHSPLQAFVAGIKITVLFLLAVAICFPAFFIIQYILGSKLKLLQMVSIILTGFTLMSAIMISFAPIAVIFLLTGGNYYFLHLLHIGIMFLSGIFGMKTIVDALKFSCEKKNVYPKVGVVVFRFWVIILAFVGIQLAWNFRPFIGEKNKSFELFRDYEGNFYAAVIYSVKQLIKEDIKQGTQPAEFYENRQVQDSLLKAIEDEKEENPFEN